jgi:hypothetical protein
LAADQPDVWLKRATTGRLRIKHPLTDFFCMLGRGEFYITLNDSRYFFPGDTINGTVFYFGISLEMGRFSAI